MPTIKDLRVFAYRVLNYRNVEDWRNDPVPQREGPWVVHCLDHDQRIGFFNYRAVRKAADTPDVCPLCREFDRRCVFCGSNRDQWKIDPKSGFTPSTGHILGQAVCNRHKYGSIPEETDYLEVRNVVLDKPHVEVYTGQASAGTKAFTVEFHAGELKFCIRLHRVADMMMQVDASAYLKALGFALQVAGQLNESLLRPTGDSASPPGYESWEQAESRRVANRSRCG